MRRVPALLALLVPLAANAGNYVDRSVHRPSDVSGHEGTIKLAEIPETERALALQGFLFLSERGKTCRITAQIGPLTGRDATKQDAGYVSADAGLDVCPGLSQPPNLNKGEVTSAEYFVSGVQVCVQGGEPADKASIRGMKVYWTQVGAAGKLTRLQEPGTWVNETGCTDWKPKVSCPDDMVAVGYRAHLGPMGFRGLGLKCAPVLNRD